MLFYRQITAGATALWRFTNALLLLLLV